MKKDYKGWKVRITKTPDGDGFIIDAEATKNKVTEQRQFRGIVSKEGALSAIKSWIDTLEIEKPDDGVVTFPEETTPETPTQDELDKQAWEADYAKLERVQKLIDLGVISADAPQVTALRDKVKADFKPAYL